MLGEGIASWKRLLVGKGGEAQQKCTGSIPGFVDHFSQELTAFVESGNCGKDSRDHGVPGLGQAAGPWCFSCKWGTRAAAAVLLLWVTHLPPLLSLPSPV